MYEHVGLCVALKNASSGVVDTEDGSAKKTLLVAAGLQNRNIVDSLARVDWIQNLGMIGMQMNADECSVEEC